MTSEMPWPSAVPTTSRYLGSGRPEGVVARGKDGLRRDIEAAFAAAMASMATNPVDIADQVEPAAAPERNLTA